MFFAYWLPWFLFGLWYFRKSYNVDDESRGSDAWCGKCIATIASAGAITFWAWPLLLVYLYSDHKKDKAKELERIKAEASRRSQEYGGKGTRC